LPLVKIARCQGLIAALRSLPTPGGCFYGGLIGLIFLDLNHLLLNNFTALPEY